MGWPYQQKPPMGWPLDYDSGLVPNAGFWPMLEGSGGQVFDSSNNGRTGIFAAAAPTWESGPNGSILRFTSASSQYIDLGTNQIILPDLTCVIRVKFADTSAAYSLFGSYNSATFQPSFWFRQNHPGATTQLYYGDLTGFSSGTVSNTLSANIWYDLAITKTGNVFSVYVNGVFKGSDTDTNYSATTKSGDSILLGAVNGSGTPAGFLNGWIERFSLYNHVLSAYEIAQLIQYPWWMYKDPAEIALLGGYQAVPTGMAGAMTTNTGYWGW